MKLIESPKTKKFSVIRSGDLFEFEGLVYLKTESIDSMGFPDCFEVGTGEKLFGSREEISKMKVTPICFIRD